MKGKMWIALAIALLMAVPGSVLASHLVAGNPETVVTGHTTLASNIFVIRDRPTDFAAIAGLAVALRRNECVVWFNGVVIFDGTGTDGGGPLATNAADPCGKIAAEFLIFAVESGDCDPRTADSAVFVRDLSFTDPNGQPHKVSEIKYTCHFEGLVPVASPQSKDEDPTLSDGQNPTFNVLGIQLINETFEEYVWATATHAIITDPTLNDLLCATPVGTSGQTQNFCVYNFALVVDSCNDDPKPFGNTGPRSSILNLPAFSSLCTDGGGKELATPAFVGPRFDDSSRTLVVHADCPATRDEIRDGNSNRDGPLTPDGGGTSDPVTCRDNHREDKSADPQFDTVDNLAPDVNETDYDLEEDHLAAEVDLYVSQENCLVGATTQVGIAFCAAGSVPQVVNHPGCVYEDDAIVGDACWDPLQGPNDAAGAGRDLTSEAP